MPVRPGVGLRVFGKGHSYGRANCLTWEKNTLMLELCTCPASVDPDEGYVVTDDGKAWRGEGGWHRDTLQRVLRRKTELYPEARCVKGTDAYDETYDFGGENVYRRGGYNDATCVHPDRYVPWEKFRAAAQAGAAYMRAAKH